MKVDFNLPMVRSVRASLDEHGNFSLVLACKCEYGPNRTVTIRVPKKDLDDKLVKAVKTALKGLVATKDEYFVRKGLATVQRHRELDGLEKE